MVPNEPIVVLWCRLRRDVVLQAVRQVVRVAEAKVAQVHAEEQLLVSIAAYKVSGMIHRD